MADRPWDQVDPWLKKTADRIKREEAQRVLEWRGVTSLPGQLEFDEEEAE